MAAYGDNTSLKEVVGDVNQDTSMCLTLGCTFDRKDVGTTNGPSLQCLFCMEWFHLVCVGVDKKHCKASFSCPTCRSMPERISKMAADVSNIRNTCSKQLQAALKESKEKDLEIERLLKENQRLHIQVAEMDAKLSAVTWAGYRNSSSKDLIAGDSTIRDLDGNKLSHTAVHCHRGAKIKDIMNDLDGFKTQAPYNDITLVVGTNDVASQPAQEMDSVLDQYRLLLEKASSMAQKVTVSSVLPRLDETKDRVDLLNAGLVALCREMPQVTYINNDTSFKLQDGEVNDGYLIANGPHVTRSGTNRLAKNLQLKVKQNTKDVTKPTNSSNNTQTTKGPQQRNTRPRSMQMKRTPGNQWRHQRYDNNHHQRYDNNQHRRSGHAEWRKSDYNNHNQANMDYLDHLDYKGRCFFCYEEGHDKHSCRHRAPVECRTCFSLGHKAKHCHGNYH